MYSEILKTASKAEIVEKLKCLYLWKQLKEERWDHNLSLCVETVVYIDCESTINLSTYSRVK